MTRHALPLRRTSWTQRLDVQGVTMYVTAGEYPDGSLGEVWIDVAKSGSTMRATLHALAMMTSIAIQHGVALPVVIDALESEKAMPDLTGAVARHLRESYVGTRPSTQPKESNG